MTAVDLVSAADVLLPVVSVNKLCAWRHNKPPPLQVDNIFAFVRQVTPVPACWQGAQPRLKSSGGPRFGPQHRGARPAKGRAAGGCQRGSPPPALGVRGCYPRKFFFENMLNPAFWWLLAALISGLPMTCISEQTTSMSRAKSVPKFQLFSRGCASGC